MKINVWNTILQLSKERGVEPSVIISAIEESLKVAASKYYTRNEDIHVDFRPEKGELRVYAVKTGGRTARQPRPGDLSGRSPADTTPTPISGKPSRSIFLPTRWAGSPPRPPNR